MKATGYEVDLKKFKRSSNIYSESTHQSVQVLYSRGAISGTYTFIFKVYHPEEDYTEAILLDSAYEDRLILLGEVIEDNSNMLVTTVSSLVKSTTMLNGILLRTQTGNIISAELVEKQVVDDFNFKNYVTIIFRNNLGELSIHELRDSHNQMMEIKVSYITSEGERHIRVLDRTEQQVADF